MALKEAGVWDDDGAEFGQGRTCSNERSGKETEARIREELEEERDRRSCPWDVKGDRKGAGNAMGRKRAQSYRRQKSVGP